MHARSPPAIHSDALSVFCPTVTFSEKSAPVVSEVFTISKDQITALKRICGGVSTFCALSAHLWQCVCGARQLPPDARTRLTFPADVRRVLRPPLPNRYFGNACIELGAAGTVGDITSEALAAVAGRIRGAIRRLNDELVRSAIDYFEMAERDGRPLKGSIPETEVRVNSWLGMRMYNADFGWGKPRLFSRAESVRGGFVYLMPGDDNSGVVRVLMCMEAPHLEAFGRLLYAE